MCYHAMGEMSPGSALSSLSEVLAMVSSRVSSVGELVQLLCEYESKGLACDVSVFDFVMQELEARTAIHD